VIGPCGEAFREYPSEIVGEASRNLMQRARWLGMGQGDGGGNVGADRADRAAAA
jgi:hypothetical protein